eukprot:7254740-Pyramimonas_sp.AAC.1
MSAAPLEDSTGALSRPSPLISRGAVELEGHCASQYLAVVVIRSRRSGDSSPVVSLRGSHSHVGDVVPSQ